jgi:beta-lactamase class A
LDDNEKIKEAAVLERSRPSVTPQQRRLLQQRRRHAAWLARNRQQQMMPQQSRSRRGQVLQTTEIFSGEQAAQRHRNVAMISSRTPTPPSGPQRSSSKIAQTQPGVLKSHRKLRFLMYLLRLGLFGLGLAVIIGTVIAILHPSPQSGTLTSSLLKQKGQPETAVSLSSLLPAAAPGAAPLPTAPVLDATKELTAAKTEIQALLKGQPNLAAGLFFYDPDSGAYVDLNADQPFAAASTIKLPLLIAFFQDVDAGKIRLDEQWVMRKDLVATEAGSMQYQPVGKKFSALETVENMIMVSDNTATNMVLDRLGKAEVVNQRFQSWGLSDTIIHNPLPDLEGTNLTSAKDLTTLMTRVSQGELLTPHSRDRALEIMRHTLTDTMLPQGLDEGATISHKTGDIGTVVGDSGLINMPSGQRYLATVMMKRPYNDPRGPETIRKISQIMYQAFKKLPHSTPPKPSESNTPTGSIPQD